MSMEEKRNPFAKPGKLPPIGEVIKRDDPERVPSSSQILISILLIGIGLPVAIIGMALVSNRFGNTDIFGLPVVALSAMLVGTGISHLFMRLGNAVLVGILVAPASLFLLFVLYWVGIILTSVLGS